MGRKHEEVVLCYGNPCTCRDWFPTKQAGDHVAGRPEQACWAAAGGEGGQQRCTHKMLGPVAPRKAPLCIFSRCAFSFSSLWGRTVSLSHIGLLSILGVEFAAHV